MIIWSRLGILVFVIVFVCSLLTEFVVESARSDNQYYQTHGWPIGAALVASAAIIWPVGRYLNRKTDEGEYVNVRTGQRITAHGGGGHSLFFIPFEYWSPIVAAIGLITAFRH
jgi:hypothetical protein